MKKTVVGIMAAMFVLGSATLNAQQIAVESKTIDTLNNNADIQYMEFDITNTTNLILTFAIWTKSEQIYANNADVWIPFRKRYGLTLYISKNGAAVSEIDKILNPDWLIAGGPDGLGNFCYYDPTRFTNQFTLSDVEPANYKIYFERYENPGGGELRTGAYDQQFPILHHNIYGSCIMNKSISPEILALIQAETDARIAADNQLASDLQDAINDYTALITAEEAARTAGDEDLADQIADQAEAIAANALAAATNADAIAANADDIATNTDNITTNTSNISSNDSDIETLQNSIDNLEDALSKVNTSAASSAITSSNGASRINLGNTTGSNSILEYDKRINGEGATTDPTVEKDARTSGTGNVLIPVVGQ